MTTRSLLKRIGTAALQALLALMIGTPAMAQDAPGPVVRLAELEVDPTQLQAFMRAAKANAQASLRDELGVFAFHVVTEKDKPTRIRVFEMYADASAYQAHLRSPHFLAFRDATDPMLLARKVFETIPVLLGAKPRLPASSLVRLAELTIAPAALDAYKAAVTEEIEASIRLEPGVLAIYAVTLKDRPNDFRFVEIYADEDAYQRHRDSPHFRKYLATTQSMISSRVLIEADPIILGAKPR